MGMARYGAGEGELRADLEALVRERSLEDRVIRRHAALKTALGREPVPHDRSVDMHVSNLRRKLGPDPRGENRIETIRGIGYQYRIS